MKGCKSRERRWGKRGERGGGGGQTDTERERAQTEEKDNQFSSRQIVKPDGDYSRSGALNGEELWLGKSWHKPDSSVSNKWVFSLCGCCAIVIIFKSFWIPLFCRILKYLKLWNSAWDWLLPVSRLLYWFGESGSDLFRFNLTSAALSVWCTPGPHWVTCKLVNSTWTIKDPGMVQHASAIILMPLATPQWSSSPC